MQLYRTSILLGHNNQSTTITAEDSSLDHTRIEQSVRQPWEDESLIRQGQSACSLFVGMDAEHKPTADSSLPGVRQMVRTGRVGEDNNMDRMTLWLQSVESKWSFLFAFGFLLNSPQRWLQTHDRILKQLVQFNRYRLPLLHPRHAVHPSGRRHNACLERSSQLTRSSTRMAKPAPVPKPLIMRQPRPILLLSLLLNPHKSASSSKKLLRCFLRHPPRPLQDEGGQRW